MSAPLFPPQTDCPPCSTQNIPVFPDSGSSCCPVCPTDGSGGGSGIPGPPGPKGAKGDPGTNGIDGIDSFTTTPGFTQPAALANVTITVANSMWMGVGQVLFIENGGYYSVVNIPNSVSVIIQNLGYTGNAAPATVIGASKVSPGGIKGADGSIITLQQVFYIATGDPNGNPSAVATRPAILYTLDGHLWAKTNATTDSAGWSMFL